MDLGPFIYYSFGIFYLPPHTYTGSFVGTVPRHVRLPMERAYHHTLDVSNSKTFLEEARRCGFTGGKIPTWFLFLRVGSHAVLRLFFVEHQQMFVHHRKKYLQQTTEMIPSQVQQGETMNLLGLITGAWATQREFHNQKPHPGVSDASWTSCWKSGVCCYKHEVRLCEICNLLSFLRLVYSKTCSPHQRLFTPIHF